MQLEFLFLNDSLRISGTSYLHCAIQKDCHFHSIGLFLAIGCSIVSILETLIIF